MFPPPAEITYSLLDNGQFAWRSDDAYPPFLHLNDEQKHALPSDLNSLSHVQIIFTLDFVLYFFPRVLLLFIFFFSRFCASDNAIYDEKVLIINDFPVIITYIYHHLSAEIAQVYRILVH